MLTDSEKVYAREPMEVLCLIEGVVDEYDLMTVKQRSYLKKVSVLIGKLIGRERTRDVVVDHERRFVSVPDEELDGVCRANEDTAGKDVVKEFLLRGELRRLVLEVVCMGGIGKTTLASRLYNSDATLNYFELCAWIVVSDQLTERYIFD